MILYDYQSRAVAELRASFRVHRRVVLHMPTGAGKTAVASELIRSAVSLGRRVVFAAHLDCLITDTVNRLSDVGIAAGRIQAGHPPTDSMVQVCSLQTMHARTARPMADLIIIDECHRSLAPTIRGIIEEYPRAWVLGLTATPERGDGQGLGDVFEAMVCGPSISHLVSIGRLVPCEVLAPDGYGKTLARDPMEILDQVRDRHPVVFTSSVRESIDLAERGGGVHVDGEMDHDLRSERLAAFSRGEARFISNCMVLTEGWDAPIADVCVIARGASHAGSYLQMVGRVRRVYPGKTMATVYDLRGVTHMHGLPDDDREYSLSGISKPPRGKSNRLKTCPSCFAVTRPVPACRRCGHVFDVRASSVINRDMSLVGKINSRDMKKQFDELMSVCTNRGYKPAWVGVKFKERFGFWPPWPIRAVGAMDRINDGRG